MFRRSQKVLESRNWKRKSLCKFYFCARSSTSFVKSSRYFQPEIAISFGLILFLVSRVTSSFPRLLLRDIECEGTEIDATTIDAVLSLRSVNKEQFRCRAVSVWTFDEFPTSHDNHSKTIPMPRAVTADDSNWIWSRASKQTQTLANKKYILVHVMTPRHRT